jgi:hypothetical protein
MELLAMNMKILLSLGLLLFTLRLAPPTFAQNGGVSPGIRGAATRAPKGMKIDGLRPGRR